VNEAGWREGEAIDLGVGQTGGARGVEIEGVGGEEGCLGGGNEAGKGEQGGVFLLRGSGREDECGGAGADGYGGDEGGEIGGHGAAGGSLKGKAQFKEKCEGGERKLGLLADAW